jgi:hypothetical protein
VLSATRQRDKTKANQDNCQPNCAAFLPTPPSVCSHVMRGQRASCKYSACVSACDAASANATHAHKDAENCACFQPTLSSCEQLPLWPLRWLLSV